MTTPRATVRRTWLPGRLRWWAIAYTPTGRIIATGRGRTHHAALDRMSQRIDEHYAARQVAALLHTEHHRREAQRAR